MKTLGKIVAVVALVAGLSSGAYGLYLQNKDLRKSSLYLLGGDFFTGFAGAGLITNKKTEDYVNKINKRLK